MFADAGAPAVHTVRAVSLVYAYGRPFAVNAGVDPLVVLANEGPAAFNTGMSALAMLADGRATTICVWPRL